MGKAACPLSDRNRIIRPCERADCCVACARPMIRGSPVARRITDAICALTFNPFLCLPLSCSEHRKPVRYRGILVRFSFHIGIPFGASQRSRRAPHASEVSEDDARTDFSEASPSKKEKGDAISRAMPIPATTSNHHGLHASPDDDGLYSDNGGALSYIRSKATTTRQSALSHNFYGGDCFYASKRGRSGNVLKRLCRVRGIYAKGRGRKRRTGAWFVGRNSPSSTMALGRRTPRVAVKRKKEGKRKRKKKKENRKKIIRK